MFSNVSCLASWRSLVMGKTVWDLHRNVSRSSRVDTFLHNEDISSNFRSSSEPTLVELLLNGHFRKLQLPPHCHGLDGVPSDTSVISHPAACILVLQPMSSLLNNFVAIYTLVHLIWFWFTSVWGLLWAVHWREATARDLNCNFIPSLSHFCSVLTRSQLKMS